jgi:6-pyruvoyltetrahydropterin/6-carboxytetrahydropterin synthase
MSEHIQLVRRIHFSCGHRYFNPQLSESENKKIYGRDYSQHGLGHNFILEAYIEGPVDKETGMVVNLKDFDLWLKEVTDPLDHHFLNHDVEFFKSQVPTAENVALYCFQELAKRITKNIKLARVRIYEGEDLWVDYVG